MNPTTKSSYRRSLQQTLRKELNLPIKTLESSCRRELNDRLCRKVSLWFDKPNPRFAGRTPTEVAREGGAGRVRYELETLLTGIDRIVEKHLRPTLLAESRCSKFVAECRQYRRKAGMTVRGLAAKAQVSEKAIQRVETGDTRWIRLPQLLRVAYLLNWRPHAPTPKHKSSATKGRRKRPLKC